MKKIQLLKKFCNAPKRELVRKICFWNMERPHSGWKYIKKIRITTLEICDQNITISKQEFYSYFWRANLKSIFKHCESIHFFYGKTQDAYLVQKLFGIFCLQVDPDGKTDFVLAKSSEFSRQLFNSGTSSCSAFSSIKLAVDNLPKFTNCSGLHDGLTQWSQFASSSIKSEIAWRWPSPFIRPLWREAGFNQWK